MSRGVVCCSVKRFGFALAAFAQLWLLDDVKGGCLARAAQLRGFGFALAAFAQLWLLDDVKGVV